MENRTEEKIEDRREYIIKVLLERGIFMPPEIIESLNDDSFVETIFEYITSTDEPDINSFLDGIIDGIKDTAKQSGDKALSDINNDILEKSSVGNNEYDSSEIGVDDVQDESVSGNNDYDNKNSTNDVIVKQSFDEIPRKRTVEDFIGYFNSRFRFMERIFRGMDELSNVVSIMRINSKKDRENIALIGMVRDKTTTKNNNIMLTLEDMTGTINVIINKSKTALFNKSQDIVLDEVIGIAGVNGDRIVFADSIIFPEIKQKNNIKKGPSEKYVLFISDLHLGSTYFMEKNFDKFLDWINGEAGDDKQKEIAGKVSHIFIVGDIVDGIGVYPGQENELTIKDINKQYEECAKKLKRIPSHIRLIICPGNHDAMRIAEPQPKIYSDFAKPIYSLPNALLVSNPSVVNIASEDGFKGFDVLLYHGYSFDHYMSDVESLRNGGGYRRPDLMMKFLLKKRHLAPTYTSAPIVPIINDDYLIIKEIPDFFATGHVHYCPILKQEDINYGNTTLISGSCWQKTTPFQIKMGHSPEPARVPIVNLKTREVKILNFMNV